MPYEATVFNVVIASPSDVQTERDLAREVVYEWNASHSRSRKIVLQPIGWETHSHPTMGDRAQGILNKQILRDADLLVAMFWSRLGTPTGEAPGGSVEELQRHMNEQKPAMVYFSAVSAPLELGATPDYQALVEFRDSWCRPRGLLESYKTHDDFKERFRRHLATKVNDDPYFARTETTLKKSGHNPSMFELSRRLSLGESLEFAAAVPDLSPEAKTLLVEASRDRNATIICSRTMSGPQLVTNQRNLIEKGDPRSAAAWESALEELRNFALVTARGHKGEIFQLTKKGFEAADLIRAQ